jgi:GNAT superfamily N-acetyltransferase
MWRGQIESVRVASSERGGGIGRTMIEWAIGECRGRGCGLVQLTTDKSRAEARSFYEGLGFQATHEGMKRALD